MFNEWGNYRTHLFTDQAVSVISSHNTSKPLFLYLAHEAVHSALAHQPLQAPQDLIDKFKHSIQDENRRIFAAMATALDQSVGKVNNANVSFLKVFFVLLRRIMCQKSAEFIDLSTGVYVSCMSCEPP